MFVACRKQILSSWEVNEEILRAELQLAGLVLSYGPKSEESWAYRFLLFSSKLICEDFMFAT